MELESKGSRTQVQATDKEMHPLLPGPAAAGLISAAHCMQSHTHTQAWPV